MSQKRRRPIHFPKMKVRGSKRRRAERLTERYVRSGDFAKDIQKFYDAIPALMVEMGRLADEVSDAMTDFIDIFGSPNPKQSDFALAAPSQN